LNKPELEHMTSDTFCFESWQEKTKNGWASFKIR
jgi:hypothetical protein